MIALKIRLVKKANIFIGRKFRASSDMTSMEAIYVIESYCSRTEYYTVRNIKSNKPINEVSQRLIDDYLARREYYD